MRIIPVMDLKSGQVVRGVAGRRAEYAPIKSTLVADSQPTTVAAAFAGSFGFQEVYLADIDAIAGDEPDWEAYRAIIAQLPQLLLDAGAGKLARVRQVVRFYEEEQIAGGIIVGLESVQNPADLAAVFNELPPDHAVFSLDLLAGQPISQTVAWQNMPAEQIAALAVEIGFRRLIILDIAQVGSNQGVSVSPLCRKLRTSFPDIELFSGGGVRGKDDLAELANSGCDAVLIATALHDGRLTASDWKT